MLNLQITKEDAQILLNALSERPFREVRDLISKVLEQSNAQIAQQEAVAKEVEKGVEPADPTAKKDD